MNLSLSEMKTIIRLMVSKLKKRYWRTTSMDERGSEKKEISSNKENCTIIYIYIYLFQLDRPLFNQFTREAGVYASEFEINGKSILSQWRKATSITQS